MAEQDSTGTVAPEVAGPHVPAAELEKLRSKLADYERWFETLDNHIRDLEWERQKFSALVNYTDVGFLLFGPDLKVVWTNTVYRERFSKAPAGGDTVGLSCSRMLCNRTTQCDDCPAAKLFASGEVVHRELNLFVGTRFHHVYATAIPVHGMDGKIEQAIVMLQDLSDLETLRRSEEAVRTTEQRMRTVFDQAGVGMVNARADGSIVQVNPTFCTMLGHTESELLRSSVRSLVHRDDLARVHAEVAAAHSRGQYSVETEKRLRRRDGTSVWCHSTAVWQLDERGKPAYCVELVHDISERKRAEKALAASQKKYEALVHSIDGIVWEADPTAFRFSFVSRQSVRILGHSVEKWLTQPRFWRNNLHPDDLEQAVATIQRVVETRRPQELEYRMVATDGRHVWLRDTISPAIAGDEVVKLRGLMVDVTEKKAAEEALKQSEEQLRQSQKMEAIGRLAGGIAHDFNNLLTAITGYGDLLIKRLGDNPLQREATEIYKAAQRAADLTGQLLAFSRQQVMQPKVFNVGDAVEDMQAMLERLIGEHVSLATDVGGAQGAVKADPGQIQQVILNLVVNARDAMPEGGVIRVGTHDIDVDEQEPGRFPGVASGSYVMLAVNDTGCGIDEETRARLFEPFFTTKEQGKGTGLGLSTVYGIVRQSGGHITVDSEPGKGSTFRVFLPRVDVEQSGAGEAAPEAEAEAATGTERILLVEDDDAVRQLAREILEMNGYDVQEARNGVEALELFREDEAAIDLCVTDLVMPQMGGRDLAREIAAERPDLRVVFLSGYTDSVILQQGLLDPGSYFLQKPFTPDDLARKVREALDT